MVATKRSEYASRSGSQKSHLSSDCGLQPAHTKLELLVIANQNVAVNTFPGLVHTARHTMGVGSTQAGELTQEAAVQGETDDWGEVVTR